MLDANQSDKVLAANRGFLSARHLQDIRKVARIARSEGTSLIVHGVVCDGLEKCICQKDESTTDITEQTAKMHVGRGSLLTKHVSGACEKPTAKQQRSARRLEEFKEAKRAAVCGARWLPLAQALLCKSRAKLRGDVQMERKRVRLALRAKMSAFFHRVWKQRALVAQPDAAVMAPWPSTPQLSKQRAPAAAPQLSVFGPESFSVDEADYDAEEQRQIEAAIAASLADAPTAEPPPVDHGAKRASHSMPHSGRSVPVKKSGGKTRSGRSTKPLQPANRG